MAMYLLFFPIARYLYFSRWLRIEIERLPASSVFFAWMCYMQINFTEFAFEHTRWVHFEGYLTDHFIMPFRVNLFINYISSPLSERDKRNLLQEKAKLQKHRTPVPVKHGHPCGQYSSY